MKQKFVPVFCGLGLQETRGVQRLGRRHPLPAEPGRSGQTKALDQRNNEAESS